MTHPSQAIDFQRVLSDSWTTIATFVPKLIFFFIVLIVGMILARVLSKIVAGILERVGFDKAAERGGVGRPCRIASTTPPTSSASS